MELSRCRRSCEGCPVHGTGHFAHILDHLPLESFLWVGDLPRLPPRAPRRTQSYHSIPTPSMNCRRRTSSGSISRGTLVFPHISTLARPPSRSAFSFTLVESVRFTRSVLRHSNEPLKCHLVLTTYIGPWSGRRRCQDGQYGTRT